MKPSWRTIIQRGHTCSQTSSKALLPTVENEEDAESKIDVGVDEDEEL
jgi:hypothetical protein